MGESAFWVLLILILISNAVGIFYIGMLEEEIEKIYELIKGKEKNKND